MKTYQFKMRAYVGSRVHRIGETIQLQDNQAAGLVRLGAIVEVHNPAPVAAAEPAQTVTPSTDSPSTDSPSTDSPSTDAPSTDAPSTDAPSNDSNAYGNLTKAQLNAELDKRGIAHDAKATNAELEALLVADDEKKATATAPVETATATPNA